MWYIMHDTGESEDFIKTETIFSCFVFCKSVCPLALCCKNFHFVLKFQACCITIKDLLWYVILLNYLLKIPWRLVRNHMISKSWFSCFLHVVEAHLLLKIFKPSFIGTLAVLLSPVSAKHLYSHKIVSLPLVSLTANLFCASSSQPYTKRSFLRCWERDHSDIHKKCSHSLEH